METSEHSPGFRWEVLKKLRRRNDSERKRYKDIVFLTNSLYESVDLYMKENRRLHVVNANLKTDLLKLQGSSDLSPQNHDDQSIFERKYAEELAELQKQTGEFAQQVVNLRSTLDSKEKELEQKCIEILDLNAALKNTEVQLKKTQQKLSETERNCKVLKDEYDSLQCTCQNSEQRMRAIEKEHHDLIAKILALKAEDADRLNAETERFMREKQAKMRKELETAAEKPVVIDTTRTKYEFLDAIVPKKVKFKFDAHDAEVNAVAWMHADFKFATAGGDRKVKIWDTVLGQPSLRGTAHESNSSLYSLDFDAEERLILASSCDHASRIWSVSDMKIKHTLTGHCGKVMSAKFLGESSKVISGSHDRTLKVWDLSRKSCIKTILATSSVNDVVASDRNGTNIVSGHYDKRIRFWDMKSDTNTNEIQLQGRITSLDLSNDGYSLLSCVRDDDTLKVIDFRMNKVVHTFSADGFLVGLDWTRAKFSPDGKFCVCGSQDGCVYIWSLSSGTKEKVLKEHSSTVIACGWSWCGKYLLSCDKSKKAVLWSEF